MMRRVSLPFAACLTALCLLAAPARARVPGNSGFNFLRLATGPRAVGMGEAHTAVADDAYAIYWNPGGLATLTRPQLALTHSQHASGVNQQYAAYAHPFMRGTVLAADVTRLTVKSFDSYDNFGARTGKVGSEDLALGLAASRSFFPHTPSLPSFGLGLHVKTIHERLANRSASTFAADAGILTWGWERALGSWARGLKAGAAVRHLGASASFVSQKTPLPTTAALGVALQSNLWGDPLTTALDVSLANDRPADVSFGAEYWVKRMLAIRAGWAGSREEGLGLRAGLGLKIYTLQMDYAFTLLGDLGVGHKFGLTFRFGERPRQAFKSSAELILSAEDLIRQHRYYEAVRDLNEALDKDPGSDKAVELLRQVKAALKKEAP